MWATGAYNPVPKAWLNLALAQSFRVIVGGLTSRSLKTPASNKLRRACVGNPLWMHKGLEWQRASCPRHRPDEICPVYRTIYTLQYLILKVPTLV